MRSWHWSVTMGLMAVIFAVFLLQLAAKIYVEQNLESVQHHVDAEQVANVLYNLLPLSADGLRHGYVWQLITFQFLHAGWLHLAGNLLGIWFLGSAIERALGGRNFLKLYFLSGIAGGLLQAALGLLMPDRFGGPVLGASAGVMGLLAAFAMFQPEAQVWIWFVIPVRARQIFWISLAIAGFFVVYPMGSHVANGAHLGGLLAGAAYVHWRFYARRFRDWLPARAARPRRAQLVKTYSFNQEFSPLGGGGTPEEMPPDEFISREVDPILDKISSQGIQSLTDRERKVLDAARRKMEKR